MALADHGAPERRILNPLQVRLFPMDAAPAFIPSPRITSCGSTSGIGGVIQCDLF